MAGPIPVPAPSRRGAALEIRSLSGRPGIRAAGEIDVITRSSWTQALEGLASVHTDVSFVELSGLTFIDVGGTAALAVTAQQLGTGRIVVERPPPELGRMLALFWPGLSTIEVAGR
ncbi:STAS domain-containing protein [Streptomyces sp. NPDC049687]|uniref:STAS domain-containing protein n=1 Tax=Streptomyces sp. NPDC049687 TaxID=3365596 RepID=UPI0037A7315B